MSNLMRTIFDQTMIMRMLAAPECDKCGHVAAGVSAVAVFTETDSFGPVGWYAVCKSCYDQEVKREDEKIVTCQDCGAKVERCLSIRWTWYDFYAQQGDEPIVICIDCESKPKHRARVRADRQEYRREMGDDD